MSHDALFGDGDVVVGDGVGRFVGDSVVVGDVVGAV